VLTGGSDTNCFAMPGAGNLSGSDCVLDVVFLNDLQK
jgi:hypothetical protein